LIGIRPNDKPELDPFNHRRPLAWLCPYEPIELLRDDDADPRGGLWARSAEASWGTNVA
jgi:hypothetical protein